MPDKRYQIFISSTFRDLVDERQAAMQAILELDHMPAGMELFPASDDTAWDLIKEVINYSDYYVLVIGGRYGSLDESGISYTEKEYTYAASLSTPVIALLNKSPESIPRENTEIDPAGWEKLVSFRQRVEAKHTCAYWSTPEELKATLITSLTKTMKRYERVGWVRSDQATASRDLKEMLALRRENDTLREKLQRMPAASGLDTSLLAQGEDELTLTCIETTFSHRDPEGYPAIVEHPYTTSWDSLLAMIGPQLLRGAFESQMRRSINESVLSALGFEQNRTQRLEQMRQILLGANQSEAATPPPEYSVPNEDIDNCITQFHALGYIDIDRTIKASPSQMIVGDPSEVFWVLTQTGKSRLLYLKAKKRPTQSP